MLFGQYWPKMNGSEWAHNPLKTVQGVILGENGIIKHIKSQTNFLSYQSKIEKSDG